LPHLTTAWHRDRGSVLSPGGPGGPAGAIGPTPPSGVPNGSTGTSPQAASRRVCRSVRSGWLQLLATSGTSLQKAISVS
jgi:hypothetical protein